LASLQQQNFKDILNKMAMVDGWSIFESGDLLALKSPAAIPLVNFVWGKVCSDNLARVKAFYGNCDFYWILTKSQKELLDVATQQQLEEFPEMIMDLSSYQIQMDKSSEVSVVKVQRTDELQLWTETAIATFGFAENDFKAFFYPLIDIANCIPLLIYYGGKPAATAMVYCTSSVAGIYAMSTKSEFRRLGLGRVAVNECLAIAKELDLDYAVLYASEDGQKLYQSMGFKISQILYEYSFPAV
jgi:ribosomal protein S18 acetylase RimI-like enzyme